MRPVRALFTEQPLPRSKRESLQLVFLTLASLQASTAVAWRKADHNAARIGERGLEPRTSHRLGARAIL